MMGALRDAKGGRRADAWRVPTPRAGEMAWSASAARRRARVVGGAVLLLILVANAAAATAGVGGRQPFREPVTLSTRDGVLEVELTVQQGVAALDTVAAPTENALLFSYRLLRGTPSNGQPEGTDLYPGPTLHVSPGETLIVHLRNAQTNLTIRDFQNPAFTAVNRKVPLYPRQLVDAPFNLHTHGLHVSPAGNGDNVLLNIPPGMVNTYTYHVPDDHPQGLYWYHTHRHMLTSPQTYRGSAGMISIGRADGGIPAVTANGLPVRLMALQYNYVFDRKGGQSVLNNPYWPANVSTLHPKIIPKDVTDPSASLVRRLANGTYEPSLAPINFLESAVGTRFFTAWWVGKLNVDNNRGIFQFMPSNLQRFEGTDGTVIPADPGLPDEQRDLQYTVNGQFQPVIRTPPGQTEIWVLGNFSDAAYVRLRVVDTATGSPVPLSIVGKDGNPVPQVLAPFDDDGTVILLEPASRVAVAVTMPPAGGLRLEMPSYAHTGGSLPLPETIENPGILYTNEGRRARAVLGDLTVDPDVVSYWDGFFYYPTQTLLTAEASEGAGTTVPFDVGEAVGAYTSFADLSNVTPDFLVDFVIGGGFSNEHASPEDPNAFAYELDGNQFPYIPIVQPRLNETQQWTFLNTNNDQHPIHIHVNDYQVHRYYDPVSGIERTNLQAGEDNQNCPAPLYDGNAVAEPGVLSLRTRFRDFIGAYVFHCHRLNHEDNGLMAVVNVIPEVTAYAYVATGERSQDGTLLRPTEVVIVDQESRAEMGRVRPFGDDASEPDVAMGDVNGDMVLDLVVGGGAGAAPVVKAYDGASAFTTLLFERMVFEPSFRGGVRVAAANIDGSQNGANVIVGSGPGMPATIAVLPSGTDRAASAPLFAQWYPFRKWSGGVDVDAGLVAETGRNAIVTVKGPGGDGLVKVFTFTLYTPLAEHDRHRHHGGALAADPGTREPDMVTSFRAFPRRFRKGLRVATGWVAGEEGGFSRIVVGEATKGGRVAVFTSGSRLNGHPEMYLTADDVSAHAHRTAFFKAVEFDAIPEADGIDVATSATPASADLVVSGVSAEGPVVAVYDVVRANEKAKTLSPVVRYYERPPAVGAVGGR